jgi:glycosyltransferase involved in cell wall biosynthesis
MPNRVSFEFIVDIILPLLTKIEKKFKIHIVGSGTEKFHDILQHSSHKDHVAIHGFKEDINKVFDGMDIAFFPILYGGGIKTKIIDSLAAGVPVVTTPEGVIGLKNLPEHCIGVGKTANQLIDEIILLMNNFSIRLSRSKKGKYYIEKELSFDVLLKKVKEIYLSI